jgi:hypothetical protein
MFSMYYSVLFRGLQLLDREFIPWLLFPGYYSLAIIPWLLFPGYYSLAIIPWLLFPGYYSQFPIPYSPFPTPFPIT